MIIRIIRLTCVSSLLWFFFQLLASPANAQGRWSGETEIGANGKGRESISQFLWYDLANTNIQIRYFQVESSFRKLEVSGGPTFKLGKDTILKARLGGTTDKEIMVAGLLGTKIRGHQFVYIADAKLPTTGKPDSLFQKAFFSLDRSNSWRLRAEHLQVGKRQAFLRIGLEYQHRLGHGTRAYVAPFYDPVNHAMGAFAGFRF